MAKKKKNASKPAKKPKDKPAPKPEVSQGDPPKDSTKPQKSTKVLMGEKIRAAITETITVNIYSAQMVSAMCKRYGVDRETAQSAIEEHAKPIIESLKS